MLTIEKAVKIARETVAEQGLRLGEIIAARFSDGDNEWCVSFAIVREPNVVILPDRVFVFVDNATGDARIPPMI